VEKVGKGDGLKGVVVNFPLDSVIETPAEKLDVP